MKEQNIFMATAHPDDEVMIAHGLKNVLDQDHRVRLCIAVHGRAGNIYGKRPSFFWEDEKTAYQNIAEIRERELNRALGVYSPHGKISYELLDLQDLGWRRGGLKGQETELKKQLLQKASAGYDAFIFPLSLPSDKAPSGWCHPDHVAVSEVLEDPEMQTIVEDRPVYRYIFYNESQPLDAIPEDILREWQPEIWEYGRDGFKLMQRLISRCYCSQARTLWNIIALTRRDYGREKYSAQKPDFYWHLGRRGPTKKNPFSEVIFSRRGGVIFSREFNLPVTS